MRFAFVGVAMALGVAGCGSHEAACIAAARAQVQALDAEIAEVDAALIRGYRVGDTPDVQIPLDRRAEVQRLADLNAERGRAAMIAEARIANCRR